MKNDLARAAAPAGRVLLLAALVPALAACGMIGDTDDVRDAYELAIDCRTDQALQAAGRATQGGGLASRLADYQKVAILREAGRTAAADAALRQLDADADAETRTEAEDAIADNVKGIRDERQKRTGQASCG